MAEQRLSVKDNLAGKKRVPSPRNRMSLEGRLKNMNLGPSDIIAQNMIKRKEIQRARTLFEMSSQTPAPSKDFVNIIVTTKGVIWRKWKITLRGLTSGAAPTPQPVEEVLSYEDYICYDVLQEEIKRTFGERIYQHIKRIIAGSNDNLSCLPEDLMLLICSMLDLQSINTLTQVNKHLRVLCSSNKLWHTLYHQYQGPPTNEVFALASEIGWKAVFYMSKIQLQKELSRRRKGSTGESISNSTHTFITD